MMENGKKADTKKTNSRYITIVIIDFFIILGVFSLLLMLGAMYFMEFWKWVLIISIVIPTV